MQIQLLRTHENMVNEISRKYILKAMSSHIKQKEIAEVIGVSPGAICQQFKNLRLSIDTMAAIDMMVEERREREEA